MKNIYKSIILLIVIFVVGLILFWPTFSLSVFGDNWLVFWAGKNTLGISQMWGSWLTYFGPYSSSHLILYMIQKFFGYSGVALYTISFLTRFMAVLGLFIFLKNRGLSLKIVLFSSLLLMVTPIGLETTDWAFQMVSYISIFFLLYSLGTIFKLNSWKSVFVFLLLFFFSVAVNPIRAHGTLSMTMILLFVELVLNKENRIYLAFSAVSIVVLFFFMSSKYTFGDPTNTFGMIMPGFNEVISQISKKDPTIIFNFLTSVGNSLIPDKFANTFYNWNLDFKIFGKSRPLFGNFAIPILVFYILYIWKFYLFRKDYLIKNPYILFAVNIVLLFLVYKSSKFPFTSSSGIQILVASTFILNMLVYSVLDFVHKHYDQVRIDVFCLSLSVLFLIFPWIYAPLSYLSSYHRYLIYPAIVLPILFAYFILSFLKLYKGKKYKLITGYLCSAFFLISFISLTNLYIKESLYLHGSDYANEVWNGIDTQIGSTNFTNRKTLFYFIADKPDRVHDSVTFGFGFHSGIRYGIWKQNDLPTVTDNFMDLKSMLTDGKASKIYIAQEYIYPKKDVFILKIEGEKVTRLKLSDIYLSK